jgi:hypothetical protein
MSTKMPGIIMKNAIFIIINILLLSAGCFANGELPLAVEFVNPNVTRISNTATEGYPTLSAKYSPNGKMLVIQTESRFVLVPTDKPDEYFNRLDKLRSWEGDAGGFLPSGKVVYSNERGIFTVDPVTYEIGTVYAVPPEDIEDGKPFSPGNLLVVSENLLVSGDGSYDMGGFKGSIMRFDAARRRMTRGAEVWTFDSASLSPNGKYVLYEHGGDNDNRADYYDIARNVNYPLARRFNFKREFPKYKKTDEVPLGWVGPEKFLAMVDENQFEESETSNREVVDTKPWLVLCDAGTGRIVWKKQLDSAAFPAYIHLLSPASALAAASDGLYEISLANGKFEKRAPIKGHDFALSSDKKRLAFIDSDQIFVSSLNGANRRSAVKFPDVWKYAGDYPELGARSLLWSPDGRLIVALGEKELLFVRL